MNVPPSPSIDPDKPENLQLYLMQIHEYMKELHTNIVLFGELMASLEKRVSHLEKLLE